MQSVILLDRKQIAKLVGKSYKTVCRWAKNGTLPEPHLKAGQNWYWTEEQIRKTKEAK